MKVAHLLGSLFPAPGLLFLAPRLTFPGPPAHFWLKMRIRKKSNQPEGLCNMPKPSTVRKKEYLAANPQAQRARTLRRMLCDLVFRTDGKTWQRATGRPALVPMPQWFLCMVGLSREAETARLQLRAHLEEQCQEGMTFHF